VEVEPYLDARLPIPLYFQLKEIFNNKIERGEWVAGQLIPTENELIQLYKVSRTTVREGINALVSEGKLVKKQGKGTIVCQPRMEEQLGRLTGFTEEMITKGYVPSARVLSIEEVSPPEQVMTGLLDGREELVLSIKRIRLADGVPVAIERSFWPRDIGRLFQHMDLSTIAFYTVLEQHGIHLRDADEVIKAKSASKQDAALLGIKEKEPMLAMERITYSTMGTPIEYSFTDYRADRYHYRVHLKR
jgi:GntR family transcriptional regulator